MSEAEQESAENVATAKAPREKASFAPVAVLAIILMPLSIGATLFISFFDNGRFEPPVNTDLNIAVVLSAPQFLEFSSGNVCDGRAPIAGLSRATIQINASGWVRKTTMGEGILNTQGKCEYKATVSPPEDFLGGDVKASINFSFGETAEYKIAVGENPPFKNVDLNINLG